MGMWPVQWQTSLCSKNSMFANCIVKFLINLFLTWYLLSEVWWDSGARVQRRAGGSWAASGSGAWWRWSQCPRSGAPGGTAESNVFAHPDPGTEGFPVQRFKDPWGLSRVWLEGRGNAWPDFLQDSWWEVGLAAWDPRESTQCSSSALCCRAGLPGPGVGRREWPKMSAISWQVSLWPRGLP